MTDVDFIIPDTPEDLKRKIRTNQYAVEEVFSLRVIPSKLQDFKRDYRNGGPLTIRPHFDTLFSILINWKHVDEVTKRDSWDSLIRALISEVSMVRTITEQSQPDRITRREHLTCLKMLLYLICQIAEQLFKELASIVNECNKGKDKANRCGTSAEEFERLLQGILKLVELPLHNLWTPPVPEEEVINLITSTCYKSLECGRVNKNKSCRDACFHILGVMIRRYSHSSAACMKLIQLVKSHEQLVASVARAVVAYSADHESKGVADDIFREIARLNFAEARDTSGTHNIALFLTEIAELSANVFFEHIARLSHLLDEESYQMRNCILSVMGEIMIQVLGTDNLGEDQKQMRDTFLDHFEDHVHDANAFVRSRSLQIWLLMINKKVVPLSRRSDLVELVLGRLQDVSSQVRKQAIQVITALVKSDPFAAKLSLSDLKENHEKESKKLGEIQPPNAASEGNRSKEVDGSEEPERDIEASGTGTMDVDEIVKQKVLVQYLEDSIEFVGQVQRAVALIAQLLGSKTITDVLEAIDFLVICYEFGLPNIDAGIRCMLNLIWSKDSSVKEAVVKAYKRLYLEPKILCPRTRAQIIVRNLSNLLIGANKGDLTSMEQLVREFVRTADLDQDVIQMLWETFTSDCADGSLQGRRLALTLLTMVASEEPSVTRENIGVIVRNGLQCRADTNLALAREACIMLQKVRNAKDDTVAVEQFRLSIENEVFRELQTKLVTSFSDTGADWIPFMEQALSVVYKLAEHPDQFAARLIQQVAEPMAPSLLCTQGAGDIGESAPFDDGDDDITVRSDLLARFLSLCGQVALKQLIFLDVDIFSELKRRHQIVEDRKEKDRKKNSSNKRRPSSVTSSKVSKLDANAKRQETDQDDDIGLGDLPNEDQDAEYIRRLCEEEIVMGNNLLAYVAPVIVDICSNPARCSDVALMSAAALALAKYMMVSSAFCEANLALMFTILERSQSCLVRANCIVALGDLSFRYPNLIEPWTPHLYGCLRDQAIHVRRNTVMMLTHLILNDMVKVKGQISEMAICILDEDQRIANLTKLFFNELSAKGNAMYNIVPDVISRLSDPENGVEEERFREILKFILTFITKDRQCEGLVDKLCQRFQACRCERQSRDLAYCLSLLPYTDRSLRKLLENIALYGNTLGDAAVYQSFSVILGNAKKFAKLEAKSLIEEMEERIEELHCKGATEEQIAANAKKASQAAQNLRRRGRGRGRQPKSTSANSPNPSPLKPMSPVKRPSRRVKKPVVKYSDTDSDCSSPARKHKTPSARQRKELDFSSDSD